MARPTVQQFIEIWEKSHNVSTVAEKTKLTKSTVQAKATQLRKIGIPLKKFKGMRRHINVEEALEFLAKIRGTSVAALKKEAEAMTKKRLRKEKKRP
jgi:ABC-type Na+ transport system ATPase subunit NatA